MKVKKEHLIDPPKKYRSLPFWSWNSKLETDETLFQVKEMDENGIGGYFMHARGGLKTEYMGKEWFDNIRAAVVDGAKRGMAPWGYDENGWPSGFGSGAVNGLGVKYWQKYIHMDITDAPIEEEYTVYNEPDGNGKNRHFHFAVNKYYVDTMDAEVTDAFIASTHEKYKEALGEDFSKMAGFFTDEPQMSRRSPGIPWSLTLPREYKKEYGEDLLPVLHHLFTDSEEAYRTRFRYFRLITRLFSENFMGRIYDWCEKNGSQLTGHMVCEDWFSSQLDCNGSVMPNYLYMHIPGIDRLCRAVERSLLAPQVTSVCAQTGRKQILTETFALCGWDVTFEELKWILEWQMVKGVNLLCQHLEGYSLGGIRKRDYPAGHFFQNPWWKDYKAFLDFAARIGMLLAEGDIKCEVLVLHTISSAWMHRCDNYPWHRAIDEKFGCKLTEVMTWLDKNQVLHHLGDESVMEKIASVDGATLKVGKMAYKTVIVPSCCNISSNTYALLKEFKANGGTLIFTGEVPTYIDGVKSDDIKALADVYASRTEDVLGLLPASARYISFQHPDGTFCDVQYAERHFDGYTMYYFVNTFSGKERAVFETNGQAVARFDYDSGEILPYAYTEKDGKVTCDVELEAKGSVVLFVYDDAADAPKEDAEEKHGLISLGGKLHGDWKIAAREQNALTLDFCDVYFDGEKAYENLPVIDVLELANNFERQVNIRLDFHVKSDFDVPGETVLVVEEPEFFEITINGKKIEQKRLGYFRDKCFIKLDISGHIVKGDNLITLTTDFVQPQHIYDTIKECYEFEGMVNKLWFDREIDAMYLLGDFCVRSESAYYPAYNHSYVTNGGFVLTPSVDTVKEGNIALQGFPFFTGKMTLAKTITLSADEIQNRSIEFTKMGAVLTKATINGTKLPTMYAAPYSFDLTGLLKEGENLIEIELTSNFRNLLGPLHVGGESYVVCPSTFNHYSKIFAGGLNKEWTDSYAFIEYGIFLK